MTQLTKVSIKPGHLSDTEWLRRLQEGLICQQLDTEHGTYNFPNLYAAVFFDIFALKLVTTIIFNDKTNANAHRVIANGFEKLHNLLTA